MAEKIDTGKDIANEAEVRVAQKKIQQVIAELNRVIFGQEKLIELVVIGVIARGHILLEGLPGLGKTELVKGLAKCLGIRSSRVQFTPDLLPGDITGNPILQERNGKKEFVFQPGAIFANFVLADEINRASPKTQSALLEAMQESRVTVFGETHELPKPFYVLATQNPIELEGTYPLPEAQVDRFLFKLNIENQRAQVLQKIVLERELGVEVEVAKIIGKQELIEIIELARKIYMPPRVANYIARIVAGTHPGNSKAADGVKYGASPRAAIALAVASKAQSLLEGRINVSFDDVKKLAPLALNHRIILDYSARVNSKTTFGVIDEIMSEVSELEEDLPKVLAES